MSSRLEGNHTSLLAFRRFHQPKAYVPPDGLLAAASSRCVMTAPSRCGQSGEHRGLEDGGLRFPSLFPLTG